MSKRSVRVTNGRVDFYLTLKGIRDNIMKIESTEKTRAYGVPEYLPLKFEGEAIKTYRANGWKVTLMK